MFESLLFSLKEYVLANNIFKMKPKYIFRDNQYQSLVTVTTKDYHILLKYCMVNNQYMHGNYEKYDKTDKELIFTFKQ